MVVFIQDSETKKVYQANAQDIRPERVVSLGTNLPEIRSMIEKIRIYPNPVRNHSLIIDSEMGFDEQIDWEITDTRGTLLDRGHLRTGGPTTLSLIGYEDGLYFLILKKHNQRLLTRKIIVESE